jgi:DNA polymerase I-like protein with 3'-5' exonuclease and polymerase domains
MGTFDAAGKWAKKQGFVSTILGRKIRFPFWGPMNYQRKQPGRTFKSREEAVAYYLRQRADGEYNLYRGKRVTSVERVNTYMALNGKMQGSNADWMKKGMVDAWNAGVCRVIGPFKVTVHDELGSSVARTRAADEAGRELVRILECATPISVPILVNSERGPDWGSTEKYE